MSRTSSPTPSLNNIQIIFKIVEIAEISTHKPYTVKPIWVNRHCMPDHGRFFLLISVILPVYTLLSCVITYHFLGEGYTCLHKWKPYPKKSNVAQLNWHKEVKFIDSWVNNMTHGLLFQFYPSFVHPLLVRVTKHLCH